MHHIGVWFKMLFKLHTSAKLVTLGSSVQSLSLRCSRGLKNPARFFSQKAEQVWHLNQLIFLFCSILSVLIYAFYMSYSPIFFFLFGGEGVGISTPSSSLVHYFCKKKLLEAHFWHNSCLIIKKVCHPYQRLFNKICNWVASLLKRQLSISPFWTFLVVGECKTFYFCLIGGTKGNSLQ